MRRTRAGPTGSRSSSLQISKCPHCAAMFSTLQNVKKNYGERVRVVFRQYPLAHIRPNARKAAKASRLPHKSPHHSQARKW